jgi:hypothetical protein
VVRGEHVSVTAEQVGDRECIVWTHGEDGRALRELPPAAAAWLAPWRDRLTRRSDARGGAPWWSVFRTDGASPDRARVVWPDLARAPHPRCLAPGDPHVPLNSCYVARFDHGDDARAFAALLASPPVAAWLAALAEPARGGYRRFLAWTVALLPVPADWACARAALGALGPSAGPDALTRAVLALYGIRAEAVEPLLAWSRAATPEPSVDGPAAGEAPPSRESPESASGRAASSPWQHASAPAPPIVVSPASSRVCEPAWLALPRLRGQAATGDGGRWR